MNRYETICPVLGVNVAVTDMNKTINFFTGNLEDLRGQYVCVSNSHTVVTAADDPEYMAVQNGACMVLPDGKPLSVVQRRKGHPEASKVSGPDVMQLMMQEDYNKYRHFFYGGKKEVLDDLISRLKMQNNGIQIAGYYSPPFRPLSDDEDLEIIKMINDSKPDFIWVGLGAPKQENWMAAHKDKLTGLMLGVGAAFDFHAGAIKRAPEWMQKCGLEWLYRLSQDPKRLFKRYLVTNTKFLIYNLLGR